MEHRTTTNVNDVFASWLENANTVANVISNFLKVKEGQSIRLSPSLETIRSSDSEKLTKRNQDGWARFLGRVSAFLLMSAIDPKGGYSIEILCEQLDNSLWTATYRLIPSNAPSHK